MNNVLIFAGGTGTRMRTNTCPKQFLELHGKPIIIYTIEHFENHQDIDNIVVVCIEGWIDHLKKLLRKYDIKKVKWIVPGGSSGQESIYNGLKVLYDNFGQDEKSLVLIHDGVRPLINQEIITENIKMAAEKKSAITVCPAIETIVKIDENNQIYDVTKRSECCMAKAPQTFYLQDIYEAHQKAIQENKMDFIDSASIMSYYGWPLYTVEGPTENIKITTPSDFYMFKSMIEVRESQQIWGL